MSHSSFIDLTCTPVSTLHTDTVPHPFLSRPLNGGAWTQQGSLLLDGPASSLQPAAGLREAVASTPSATIWFCDLQEGSSSALVDAHADAVALLCCSPGGGDKLATAAGDGRLRVWQPGGGRQVSCTVPALLDCDRAAITLLDCVWTAVTHCLTLFEQRSHCLTVFEHWSRNMCL